MKNSLYVHSSLHCTAFVCFSKKSFQTQVERLVILPYNLFLQNHLDSNYSLDLKIALCFDHLGFYSPWPQNLIESENQEVSSTLDSNPWNGAQAQEGNVISHIAKETNALY